MAHDWKALAKRYKQDRTIALCAEAIRKRAEYLKRTGYEDGTVLLVRNVAYWLESEQGRGLVIDLSIRASQCTECEGDGTGVQCVLRGKHEGGHTVKHPPATGAPKHSHYLCPSGRVGCQLCE